MYHNFCMFAKIPLRGTHIEDEKVKFHYGNTT